MTAGGRALTGATKKARQLRAFVKGEPVHCTWQLSPRCESFCHFCEHRAESAADELDAGACGEVAAELGRRVSLLVSFTGSEPFLRGDLGQVVAAAARWHFPLLVTNGWLVAPSRAREVWEAGLEAATVALEDAESDRHDKEKKVYLTKLTQEKESYERALQELERSASRIDSLLRELEARRRALAARPPAATTAPRGVKGSLPWPAEGSVITHFGRQKHPTFNTYVQRKGIEIRTTEGSAIHAVMPGTVVYADWLKGYGLVIILDHANGFFSLYAHASKILTTVGAQVGSGQAIGETGDTGMTGENTLYFELHPHPHQLTGGEIARRRCCPRRDLSPTFGTTLPRSSRPRRSAFRA